MRKKVNSALYISAGPGLEARAVQPVEPSHSNDAKIRTFLTNLSKDVELGFEVIF